MNRWSALLLLMAALLVPPAARAQGKPPALNLPIACEPGRTCVVQSYMDHDPGPGAKDYRCGSRAYDKHSGVDIRILDLAAMRAGVPVLAAAPGTVFRLRDGMEDLSIRERVGGTNFQDCGNTVIIRHGDGWTTQYCHMRQGSVRVKEGQQLKAGDVIGLVGLTGNTEFPHLHVTVQHNGQVVDPFAFGLVPGACGAGSGLWAPAVAAQLAYKEREVFGVGFAGSAVDFKAVESGTIARATRTGSLVAYVRALGLKAGDTQALRLIGPDGATIIDAPPAMVPRDQAQRIIFAGKKPPAGGWKPGLYRAQYTVRSGGKQVLERRFEIRL